MIRLHRLGHPDEPFHLNPDLILPVEATPDTVVTLITGTKVLVCERPDQIVAAVRDWRTEILSGARRGRHAGLALVRGSAGEPGSALRALERPREDGR